MDDGPTDWADVSVKSAQPPTVYNTMYIVQGAAINVPRRKRQFLGIDLMF